MWLWGTTIDQRVSAASQGAMYAKFEDLEKEKAEKPKPSPWVTIGNVTTEVPLSAAGLPVTGAATDIEGIPGIDYDVLAQKPFRRNHLVDVEKEAIIEKKRPMWANRIEFVIASMAMLWSVDSLTGFFNAMVVYGGGAFLIPYFLFYFTFSIPTIIIEMLIGQVFRRGVIVNMERIHKFFSGVGKSIFFIAFVKNIYFNTTTAWGLYNSIKGIWTAADEQGSYPGSGECAEWGWTGVQLFCCKESNPLFHWYYQFHHLSSAPFSGLDFSWYTSYDRYWPFIAIAITWFLIGAVLCSAFWFRGKIYYFSLVFPLLVFLFVFAKSFGTWNLNAEHVDEPIAQLFQLFEVRWEALLDAKTWIVAAEQALRSAFVGVGVFSTFAGYTDPKQNLISEGILISLWGMLIPLISALLLLPLASYYTVIPSLNTLEELPLDTSLLYVIIPTVIKSIESVVTGTVFANVLVAIYFMALLTLTTVTATAVGEVIITALMDIEFPNKIVPFKLPYKRTILAMAYATVSCAIGMVFGLQNGVYLFDLFDQAVYPVPSIFIACAEVFALVWIYSIYRFNDDLWLKCGYQIPVLFQQYVTWILAPGLFAAFLAAVYLQIDRSILNPVIKTIEYVISTAVDAVTGESIATNTTTVIREVNYGYPALVDCTVAPEFRQFKEWPVAVLVVQWLIIVLCALLPLWSSISYNAQTRDKWRIYKHKRKYPLGVVYPTDARGKWATPQVYVVAQAGAAIGVGILGRFAYKYYAYGKYIFLIQCLIVHLLFILPVFILEIDLGQIFRSGPISVWKKVHPIFSGLGWSSAFLSLFLAVLYLYPTMDVMLYILQLLKNLFLSDYKEVDVLIKEAISSDSSPRPHYLPVEAQNIFPWTSCIHQICDISPDLDCSSPLDYSLEQIYEMAPNMCKYSPALFQFQHVYLNYTENWQGTILMKTFFDETAVFANSTVVFSEIKDFFFSQMELYYIISIGGILSLTALITLTKPSMRNLIVVVLYILPLLGIIAGCIYIALRGGANDDLFDMLFDLKIPDGVTFSQHLLELLSNTKTWAEAGIVAISLHFVATGVNIAFASYNPRETWVNMQGIIITFYTWFGNIVFLVFFFLNVCYLKLITNTWEKRVRYGLVDRVSFDIDAIMDIESGGSLVFMATLADSLSFHKHTIAVLPIMLICILLLCVGTLQAFIETLSTSFYGAGFLSFSRIPSCILACLICTLMSVVYTLKGGVGFFIFQILERFVYGWPVPLLSALMVLSSTWVYSMYRLNNAMFMYSMHHLSYYWMILWPFFTPLGLLVLSGYNGYLNYSEFLSGTMAYVGSQPFDFDLTNEQANNTELLKIYLKDTYWPDSIVYVSSTMYALYLVPFVLTFVVVGLINCFKQFPCKPICYEYFEDEEEQDKKGDLEETDIVHIHSRSLESKSNSKKEDDDISPDNISMEYSDDDVELEHAASDTEENKKPVGISIYFENDTEDPFIRKRKAIQEAGTEEEVSADKQ